MTGRAIEIHASTRPRPWWRAELESSSSSRRRDSATSEEILDRNICFVDFPTHSKAGDISSEVLYVEEQLISALNKPMEDADLWAFLSSGAHPIVDAVLYLLPHSGMMRLVLPEILYTMETNELTGPMQSDIATMKALQSITNLIPLLAHSDEYGDEEMTLSKLAVRRKLESEVIGCFSFAMPDLPEEESTIYAVSSVLQSDDDVIDASVLMSSDYIQPLASSDLSRLVDDLLSQDGSSRLRHCAALKCINWRHQRGLGSSFQPVSSYQTMAVTVPLAPSLPVGTFVQHQRWRRIEAVNWADSLQQSLTTERLDEMMSQFAWSESIACEMPLARVPTRKENRRSRALKVSNDFPHQDPLGLLQVVSQFKCRGKVTLELLSSLGVVGGVAAWLVHPE